MVAWSRGRAAGLCCLAVGLSVVDAVTRQRALYDACWLGREARSLRRRRNWIHRRRSIPGVLVYRLDDRLFFANTSYVEGRIREAISGAPAPVDWLVFDAESLNHVDATGVRMLTELIESLRRNRSPSSSPVFMARRATD